MRKVEVYRPTVAPPPPEVIPKRFGVPIRLDPAAGFAGGCAFIHGDPGHGNSWFFCNAEICEVWNGRALALSSYCPYHARLCNPSLSVVRREPGGAEPAARVGPGNPDSDQRRVGGHAQPAAGKAVRPAA